MVEGMCVVGVCGEVCVVRCVWWVVSGGGGCMVGVCGWGGGEVCGGGVWWSVWERLGV